METVLGRRRHRRRATGCPSFLPIPKADSFFFEKNALNSRPICSPLPVRRKLRWLWPLFAISMAGLSLAAHHHPLIDPLMPTLGLETLYVEQRPEGRLLERCSVGITACDALIAQTGSILLTARSAGGRALSVLPPHHVVVATADQLLPDLPAAFELLYRKYGQNYPSFATFITGPSRTGDIERILVLGAHGPRILTILLIGSG